LGVNGVESAIDVGPRLRRRGKMALEYVLAIPHAFGHGVLHLFEFSAALPAGFEVRADVAGGAGCRLPVGVKEQLLISRMANRLRMAHVGLLIIHLSSAARWRASGIRLPPRR